MSYCLQKEEEEGGRERRRHKRKETSERIERLCKSGREKSKRMGDSGEEDVEEEIRTLFVTEKFPRKRGIARTKERDRERERERELKIMQKLRIFT